MRTKFFHLTKIFLSAVLVFGLAGCTTNNTVTVNPTTAPSATEEVTLDSPVDSDGNEETFDYVIEMNSFSFSPNAMQASPGQTLKVKLVNKDSHHDLVIDELKVRSAELSADETQVLEIKIPADAGGKSYQFYCSVGTHKVFGMVGTLTVRDE